ncbi:MAG: hypothetical protein WDN46_11880 [Methylocella sp.]
MRASASYGCPLIQMIWAIEASGAASLIEIRVQLWTGGVSFSYPTLDVILARVRDD